MEMLSQIYSLFKEITENSTDGFSGIGLVVYDSNEFNAALHCDLRPNIAPPKLNISSHKMCNYLIEISDYRHALHDGFHFVDHNGNLTHVAQYFVPSIVNNLEPNQEHGVRLFSSICGSTIKGVLFIATICSSGEIYFFQSGKQVKLNDLMFEEKK